MKMFIAHILSMSLHIKLAMKSGSPSEKVNTRHTNSGVGLAKYMRCS